MVLRAAGFVVALLGGCQPEIGDDCMLSTDCSQQGDRLCDTTQPGGYCTIFNCEPGGCPEEAVCVAFAGSPVSAAACDALSSSQLKRRTFCLRTCEGSGDCRSGYECANLGEPGNAWGASMVDTKSSGRACVVPASVSAPDADPGACEPVEGGTEQRPEAAGAGAGGEAAGAWAGGGAASVKALP